VATVSEPQPARQRRTRADAERRRLEILEAAARLLGRRPEPSVEEVAAATGVSRQTVYAHYPSRDALRAAAFDHAVTAALAAMDAAEPGSSGATCTLLRVLEQSWRTLERYPVLMDPPPQAAASDWAQHQPVADRLLRLVARGQRNGEIDPERPAEWLVAATIALGHAAAGQVAADLLPPDRAMAELRLAIRRVLAPAATPDGPAAVVD
jgi:AcrR family transcriptional regulator